MDKQVRGVGEIHLPNPFHVVVNATVLLKALDDELGPQSGLGVGVVIGVLGIGDAVQVPLRFGLNLRRPLVEFRLRGRDVEGFRPGQALAQSRLTTARSTFSSSAGLMARSSW